MAKAKKKTKTKGGKLRQTGGKRTVRGLLQDEKISAKKPGRRISKTGKVYYERRGNRSDRDPKKKL